MTSPKLVLCELPDPNLAGFESYSPFCLKVHRALRLCALPYERRFAADPGAFKHLNPAGQVPVLLVDGEAVADSTRIVSRLDAISGHTLSRGLDARARAEAFLWEEMADGVLGGFLVAARWIDDDNWGKTKAAYFTGMPGVVRAIVPDRIRRRIRGGLARDVVRPDLKTTWRNFQEILDGLEDRAPAEGFWLGPSPSRADVALFAQLHSFRTPLTLGQAGWVAARSRLSAWLGRVDAACSSAVVTDAALDRLGERARDAPGVVVAFG
jgi:glutathione S-transferase